MGITRRRFVGCVAAAATIGLPRDLWRYGAIPRWVLLDLKEACSLSESVSGYESALAAVGEPWIRSDAWSVTRCTGLIVPAALAIPLPAVRAIVTCLARGATVILESGAAFAGGPDFRAHRAVLRDCFQVRIEAPGSPFDSTFLTSDPEPDVDSFRISLVRALVDDADLRSSPGRSELCLVMHREP